MTTLNYENVHFIRTRSDMSYECNYKCPNCDTFTIDVDVYSTVPNKDYTTFCKFKCRECYTYCHLKFDHRIFMFNVVIYGKEILLLTTAWQTK